MMRLGAVALLAFLGTAAGAFADEPHSFECAPLEFQSSSQNHPLDESVARIRGELRVTEPSSDGASYGIHAILEIEEENASAPTPVLARADYFGYEQKSELQDRVVLTSPDDHGSAVLDFKNLGESEARLTYRGRTVRMKTNCAKKDALSPYLRSISEIKSDPLASHRYGPENLLFNSACSDRASPTDFVRACSNPEAFAEALFKERSSDPCMRTSFLNAGGIRDGGLCWWHSRFQQNAWQLAAFAPEKPRPDPEMLYRLLLSLYRGDRVVEFPGFKNWAEVSLVGRPFIFAIMAEKQKKDAFHLESWKVWALKPNTPNENWKFGRAIERNFNQGFSTYIYVKYKLTAYHAKVVHSVRRVGNHLTIEMVDSDIRPSEEFFHSGRSSRNQMVIIEKDDGTATAINPPSDTWKPGKLDFPKRVLRAWQDLCRTSPQI